jgi:hypothetical protein
MQYISWQCKNLNIEMSYILQNLLVFVCYWQYILKSMCNNKVHGIKCNSATVLLSYGETKENQFAGEKGLKLI